MSYVLHVYRMTYKTYDMQEYIFVHPEEWYSMSQFFGIYLFHPLDIAKNESFLGGFAPPATWANHRSVFMVLGFILSKTLCPQKHSKVCFELLKTFRVTPERPCPNRGGSPPKSDYLIPICRYEKMLFHSIGESNHIKIAGD